LNRQYLAVAIVVLVATVAVSAAYLQRGACAQSNSHTSDGPNSLPLNFGGASSDLWNLKSTEGSTEMCYQGSRLSTTVDMKNISGSDQVHVVIAYPHIGYGYGEFDGSFGQLSPNLTFPMPIESFERSNVSYIVGYSVTAPQSQPLNFAYDLWIEGSPQPGHKALLSDLEVMVWLYNATLQPAGVQQGTISTSTLMDGKQTTVNWTVFATKPSSTIRTLITYLLTPPRQSGSMSLQLGAFVKDAVAKYWQPTQQQSYYLMGIELGSEFEAPGNAASLSWTVSSFVARDANGTVEIV